MNDLEELKRVYDSLSPELKEEFKQYACGSVGGGTSRTSLDDATHAVTGDQAGYMALSRIGQDRTADEIWAARAKSAKADFARGFRHTKTKPAKNSH